MAWLNWLIPHWLDLLQSIGIVGGLSLTCWSLHSDAEAQRAANLIKLTELHRDLWMTLLTIPKLARILDNKIDLRVSPPTDEESRFVSLIILHLNSAYYAIKANTLPKLYGLPADVRSFFALPIPQSVWQQSQHFYDDNFVSFVESQRRGRKSN